MLIAKIVSGGQTGVDRGAIEAALELGFPYGGLIPKGRLAEDGARPRRTASIAGSTARVPASARRSPRTARAASARPSRVKSTAGSTPTTSPRRRSQLRRARRRSLWRSPPRSDQ